MDKKKLEKIKRLTKLKNLKKSEDTKKPKNYKEKVGKLYLAEFDEYPTDATYEIAPMAPEEMEPAPPEEIVPVNPEKFTPPHLWELPAEDKPLQEPVTEQKFDQKPTNTKEKISHASLLLTTDCNLQCPYCYHKGGKVQTMEENMAYFIIDFLLNNSGPELSINFFGGEPLLEFRLIENIVSYTRKKAVAERKKVSFSINTNGLLLNEYITNFLWLNNIGTTISIDGTPASHDMFRIDKTGDGTYNQLMSKLPLLLKKPRLVHVRMTVTPHTVEDMFEGVRNIYRLGFRTLGIAMDRSNELWNGSKQGIFFNEYERILLWYMEIVREGEDFFLIDLDHGAASLVCEKDEKRLPCGAAVSGVAITPRGTLYPCYRFVTIAGSEVGDVFNGFNREREKYLYSNYYDFSKCKSCNFKSICHRCPWLSYLRTGNISIPIEINCFEAELMKNLFYEYHRTMETENDPNFKKRIQNIKKYFST
ncbi:MAG: radical SAM protein [Vulcanimicrobiota bacterium]